jgi:8-oxo-dGTP diphosphatase
MKQKKESVNGVILSPDKSHLLLIKRRDVPVWVLPGGGIEKGEEAEEAILREIKEETGYQACITRKVAEYTPTNCLTLLTHLFECKVVSGMPILSKESKAIAFFPIHSLPKMPPPYFYWIEDTLKNKANLIKRPISEISFRVVLKNICLHPIFSARFFLARLGLPINS